MSGLVDFLSNWLRRFCSSPGLDFSCYSLLFWLKKLSFYWILLLWDLYDHQDCVHGSPGTWILSCRQEGALACSLLQVQWDHPDLLDNWFQLCWELALTHSWRTEMV